MEVEPISISHDLYRASPIPHLLLLIIIMLINALLSYTMRTCVQSTAACFEFMNASCRIVSEISQRR